MKPELTEQDIIDLKRSWGKGWRKHANGKSKVESKAIALHAKMNGAGWEIRVHENLGWCYSVENGPLAVYEYNDTYSCLMSDTPQAGGGAGIWTLSGQTYNDPNEAVRMQIKEADKVVKGLAAIVEMAKKAVDYDAS